MAAKKLEKCGNEVRTKRARVYIIICTAISVLLWIYIFVKQSRLSDLHGVEILRVACDASVVCGLIAMGIFLLNLCHYHGAFDFAFYGVNVVLDLLFRRKEEENISKFVDFATYLRQNTENKRMNKVYLWFGIGFLVLGGILLGLYML